MTIPIAVTDRIGGNITGATANFQNVPTGFGTPVIVPLLGNDNDPDAVPRTITVKKRPYAGILRLSNGPPMTVGEVLTARQLANLVIDAPVGFRGNRPVKSLNSMSNGRDVPTSRVNISIVKGRSCFASLPATFKAGAKKRKDCAFRVALNEAGGSETFSFPGGVSAG